MYLKVHPFQNHKSLVVPKRTLGGVALPVIGRKEVHCELANACCFAFILLLVDQPVKPNIFGDLTNKLNQRQEYIDTGMISIGQQSLDINGYLPVERRVNWPGRDCKGRSVLTLWLSEN